MKLKAKWHRHFDDNLKRNSFHTTDAFCCDEKQKPMFRAYNVQRSTIYIQDLPLTCCDLKSHHPFPSSARLSQLFNRTRQVVKSVATRASEGASDY